MNKNSETKNIFPIEITEFSYESLFVKNNSTSRIIYLIVIVFLLFAFALLPIIKVDVSKQSRGIIRTMQNNNPIYSSKYGKVVYQKLAENLPVSKGDTLMIIDSEESNEKLSLIGNQISILNDQLNDLKILTNKNIINPKLKSSKFLQQWTEYKEKINDLKIKLNYAEREYNIAKQLFEGDALSKTEFEDKKFNLNLAQQAIDISMESQINNWQSENYQLTMQLIELNSQKKQLISDKEKYTIVAAIDGVIVNYSGTLEGNIISPNQKIAEITTVRDLIAECYVSPADIGLIHDNMFVKFQIDAFNYNQWGLATGKVIDISEDLVAIQDNPVFIVKCTIDQKYLELKNKYKGNLSKGLTLTGRFQVTRRSLFQLLFDKVDNWLNPKLIKK